MRFFSLLLGRQGRRGSQGPAAAAAVLPRERHGGGTPLKPGDEVRFTLANKPSRIGEATPGPGGQGAGAAGGGADKDRGPGGGPAGGPPRELIARRVVRTKVGRHCPSQVLGACLLRGHMVPSSTSMEARSSIG